MLTKPDIPVLATERLVLCSHDGSDLVDYAAMWADPLVTRYIGGKPCTVEEAWGKLLRHIGHWSLKGFGYWVIRERAANRFVGEVGFADFKRAIEPSFGDAPEAGWALAPWAHGKGFATEATRAAIGWFEGRFGSIRTVCLIAPENAPSIRVAEKCGYAEAERTTYNGEPTIVFAR